MVIEVTVTGKNIEKLTKRINDRAAIRAWDDANWVALRMEHHVVDIVSREFRNDRADDRRKKGTTKLINSFQGYVIGTRGQVPVHAQLGIKPGVNEKKVAALENGSPAHWIDPGEKGWLSFPRDVTDEGTLENLAGRIRSRNAYGRGPKFATNEPVFHPGNRAYRFMERARDRARRDLRNR